MIVAHNLPIRLRKELTAYMTKASWKIVDMGYWAELTNFDRPWPETAMWDAKKDSILISGVFAG